MGIPYRSEIDGLRAIAVAAVVLYHAGLGGAGYVGVDIFFVISGYLITALLLREYSRTGRIDLADFYARRVRRIFPAGIAVILAVLVCVPILPPHAQGEVLASAAAAAVFGANVFFQVTTSGYFTGDAGQIPLLHLWSLSVEEQFYLLWPALLLFARSRRTFAIIGVTSFVLAEGLMLSHPSAAFYQMPARAWELAAGAYIAASPIKALPRWTAWAGLCAVLVACVFPLPHFPGWGALPAVAGATLVLWAIHGGADNRLLASRPFVGIGLISYSLYLWHWPLLAIDRLLRVGPAPLETRLALVAVALILAFASYRYIETPLRRPWGSSRRTVAIGFATMALLSCGTWAWRTPEPPKFVAAAICHPGQPARMQRASCLGKGPKVLVWGDSYAVAWGVMAEQIATRQQMPVGTLARDGCPAVLGPTLIYPTPEYATVCPKSNADAMRYLQANHADTLIISSRWDKWRGDPEGYAGMERAVAAASPFVRRILVIAPTPVMADRPDKCALLKLDCSVSRADFEASGLNDWVVLRRMAADPKVTVLDPAQWLCGPERCDISADGIVLYTDGAHVSPDAARSYASKVPGG